MRTNNWLKIVSLLLALVFAMSVFAACDMLDLDNGETKAETNADTAPSSNEGESDEAEDTTPPEDTTSSLTLNGVDIKEYSIVYAEGDIVAEAMANNIKDAVLEATGAELKIKTDSKKASGKEILVGNSKRTAAGKPAESIGTATEALEENNMLMYTEGDFFFIGGKAGNNVALLAAANRLVDAIKDAKKNTDISFNYNTPVAPNQTSYRIMTYNDGDLTFGSITLTYRASIIKEYAPDIIGFQEFQAADQKKYEAALPGYKFVYYNHEILTSTHSPVSLYGAPIAYLASKFDLVESGTQWLSDTPDEPNSKFRETAYIRSYVYAILKDKTTGEEFVIINTHIDYDKAANTKQIKTLLELTEKFKGKPIVYTGDFNMKYTADGFNMMESAGFRDSGRYLTKESSNIDYIFFDYTKADVVYYKRIDDHLYSAGMPQAGSDHNPYIADVVIPS